MLTRLLILVHAGVGALWLGAMAYSLFTVQPKLAAMVGGDAERVEDAQRILAHGNRWRVVGLIGTLWATGIALAVVVTPRDWPVVAAKAVLLAAASALFWWVSWRGWPRRVFALPDELPALQRRFRRAATAMLGLVGIAFVISFLNGS
jgi:Flp pilus assembly protein TadB